MFLFFKDVMKRIFLTNIYSRQYFFNPDVAFFYIYLKYFVKTDAI